MSDNHTEVTQQSWFSRLGDAIKGVIVGIVLFLAALILLFYNEGRAVKTAKALNEGAKSVISADAGQVSGKNEGKLVHVTGKAVTDETLKDATWGISSSAIRLKRTVEMYQWKESSTQNTEKKLGGGTETTTTYNYEKGWSPVLVDSSKFKVQDGHQNPAVMPCKEDIQAASKVKIGAFQLAKDQIAMMQSFSALAVSADTKVPAEFAGKAKITNGMFYIGNDLANPQIGDVKVSFSTVPSQDISVIAKQTGSSFSPYVTKAGKALNILKIGTVSAETMFQQEKSGNSALTWALRILGFILMIIGVSLVLRPISVFADVLPILGDIAEAGIFVIALCLAAVCSLLTIAVAWLFFRPLLSVLLCAVICAVVFFIKQKMAKVKSAAKQNTAEASAE